MSGRRNGKPSARPALPTVWTEEQVCIPALAAHFRESGLGIVDEYDDRIVLSSEYGFGIVVVIDTERKYLCLSACMPISTSRFREDKLERIQQFNYDVFLPGFSLDRDEDLRVEYVMCFEYGLIIGQCVRVVRRFGGVLDYLCRAKNDDLMIDFDKSGPVTSVQADAGTDGPATSPLLLN